MYSNYVMFHGQSRTFEWFRHLGTRMYCTVLAVLCSSSSDKKAKGRLRTRTSTSLVEVERCRVLCYYVLCSLSGQVQRNLFLRKLLRIKWSVANLSEACRYGVARMFLKAPRSQEQNAPLVDNSVTSPFGVLVVGRAGFKVVCPHSRNIVVVYLTSARKNKKMTNTTLFTSVQHLFLRLFNTEDCESHGTNP